MPPKFPISPRAKRYQGDVIDDSWAGSALQNWIGLVTQAAQILQRPLDKVKDYKDILTGRGFSNVREDIYKWPSNTWPRDPKFKEIGMWTLANIDAGVEGISMALLTRGLGWTMEEVQVFLVDVRKDMRNKSIHSYWPL